MNNARDIINNDALYRVTVSDMTFFIDRGHSVLKDNLVFLDDLLNNGLPIKNSRSTTAAVLELPDCKPVFVKRENNKGVKFTLKYLFRCSRVFRAATAAARLERLGISTPKVLAVGSRRNNGVLKSGYLITESLDQVLCPEVLCRKLNTENGFYNDYMDRICHITGLMHENGICHGDLKISNIYCRETDNGYSLGLWDLDGTHFYTGKLPLRYRARELGRLASSYILLSHKFTGKIPGAGTVCSDLLDRYRRYAVMAPEIGAIRYCADSYLKRHLPQ